MDINWIIKGVLMFGGGWAIIEGLLKLVNDDLENKCSAFGYQLFKFKVSWRRAYWDCVLTVIKWPLVIIGAAVGFVAYRNLYIWETLIAAIILTIPLTLAQIMPFLRKVEKEAKKSYEKG